MDQLYRQLLSEFLSFKSVSTDPQFLPEIEKTVAWLKETFERNGFSVHVVHGYDNPLVVATYMADPSFKTVLVYGHYDVQPADQAEGWSADPFTLTEKNNRLYGRGVIDNKGQVLVHMVNVFQAIQGKTLGYNVAFMLEGNEETGSPLLASFIEKHKDLLRSDFVLLSDGEISGNAPNAEIGFRGVFNSTLTISVGTTDLHSGLYGGAAPNAIHELSKVISRFYDPANKLADQGLYTGSAPITPEIVENNKRISFSLAEYQKTTGRKVFFTQDGLDIFTRVGLLPSIEVTGIQSGYTGEGYRNAIPYRAMAKINVRLSPTQDPEAVFAAFKKFIAGIVPSYVDWDLSFDQYNQGVFLETHNEYVARAQAVLERVWAKPVLRKYVGGSLPIITYFAQMLHAPVVSIPLVNEDCAMHAADENFDLTYWDKAMAFSKQFFSKS